MENIFYKTIALVPEVDNKKMNEYVTNADTTEIEVLCILNNVNQVSVINNDGKQLKVFNHVPLTLFKE